MPVPESASPAVSPVVHRGADSQAFLPLRAPQAERPVFRASKPAGGIPLQTSKQAPLHLERNTHTLRSADRGSACDIETRKAELRKAAQGFEAIFIRQLLKTMRSSVPGGGMYGGGVSGDIYADTVENALAESMAKQGRFGIADILCREMTKRLELEAKTDSSKSAAESTDSLP
jgi:flagellar protein FlgJ